MTIIRSLGGSSLNPRRGFARGEEGNRQNVSRKPEQREWRSKRESR